MQQQPISRNSLWHSEIFLRPPFNFLNFSTQCSQAKSWPTLATMGRWFAEAKVVNDSGKQVVPVLQPLSKPPRPLQSYEVLYEPRIFLRGEIYTRASHWHDLFNALVWLSFPKTKAALNARHYRAFIERNPLPISKLHNRRSPEQDALTLFDEGGSILWRDNDDKEHLVLFGHGAYECLLYEKRNFSSGTIYFEEPCTNIGELDLRLAQKIAQKQLLTSSADFHGTAAEKFIS